MLRVATGRERSGKSLEILNKAKEVLNSTSKLVKVRELSIYLPLGLIRAFSVLLARYCCSQKNFCGFTAKDSSFMVNENWFLLNEKSGNLLLDR